ncbi:MAG: hypothetical protein AAGN46_03165 [Acidobacteriota bacterium]
MALALMAWALPLAGEELALPAELSLDDAIALRLELDGAEIEARTVRDGPPTLRAEVLEVDAEGRPRAASLQIDSVDGVPTLRRAAARPTPRLRLELRLDPRQALTVVGGDLQVTIEDPLLPADEERLQDFEEELEGERFRDREDDKREDEPEDPTRGILTLELRESQLDVLGGRAMVVQADRSWVRLDRCGDRAELTVNGGSFDVVGHRGSVDVLATDARGSVSGLDGPLKADLLGGTLDLDDARGTLDLTGAGAIVRATRWVGKTTVDSTDGDLELREIESARGTKIKATGGRVAIADWTGRLDLEVAVADLDVDTLTGDAVARFGEQVQADMRAISGRLRLESDDSDLELAAVGRADLEMRRGVLRVDDVRQLGVTGEELDVTGSGIAQIVAFEVVDSTVDLDLGAVPRRGTTRLRLLGLSTADVQLEPPCVVQVQADGELDGVQVEADGCDLRLPGQPLVSFKSRRRYGDKPQNLTLTLSEDAEVQVGAF